MRAFELAERDLIQPRPATLNNGNAMLLNDVRVGRRKRLSGVRTAEMQTSQSHCVGAVRLDHVRLDSRQHNTSKLLAYPHLSDEPHPG